MKNTRLAINQKCTRSLRFAMQADFRSACWAMKYEPGLSPLQEVWGEGLFIFRELELVFILGGARACFDFGALAKTEDFFFREFGRPLS